MVEPPTGMADDIAFADDGTMAWTAFLLGKVYVRKPNGKTIEVANGMSGPNSLAFGKDGRLFVSEVFLGDALYEIDLKNVDKPDFKPFARNELRRIAEKLGGLNGFEIHKDDGFLYGPLWFKGEVVKINLETGAIDVIASGFKIAGRRQHRSAEPRQSLCRRHRHRRRLERQPHQQGQEAGGLDEARPRQSRLRFARPPVRDLDDRQRHLSRRQADRRAPGPSSRASSPSRPISPSPPRAARTRCMWPTSSAIARSTAQSGAVTDVLRVHGETHAYPIGISVGPKHVLLSSWFSNTVEKVDRKTGKLVATLGRLRRTGRRAGGAPTARSMSRNWRAAIS